MSYEEVMGDAIDDVMVAVRIKSIARENKLCAELEAGVAKRDLTWAEDVCIRAGAMTGTNDRARKASLHAWTEYYMSARESADDELKVATADYEEASDVVKMQENLIALVRRG